MAAQTLNIRADSAPHLVAMLKALIELDPTVCAAEVIAGGQLFAVECDGRDVAAFLLRRDGDECVIVAAAGGLPGINLLDVILPHIEATCGARWVRIHSHRKGMMRQLQRHGYGVAEVVYRKEVGNVGGR